MRSTSRIPRVPALLGAAALLGASLAGCSAIPGFGGCDPVYESGDASSLVTATGDLGSKPDVEFPTPLVTKKAEVTVLEHGEGELVRDGAQVDFSVATFYGADGQDLTGDTAGGRLEAGLDGKSISSALTCAHVGDRLALATTAAEAYGEGVAESGGIKDDDTVVVVIDITAAYLGKADGLNQLPKDGLPMVATEVDGTPGIMVPAEDPPTTTQISVIKGGDGPKLKADDEVVTHYSLWTWPTTVGDDPTTVSSTWESKTANNIVLQEGLPKGLLDSLIGQRVGSQVLLVLAPGDDSFTADSAPAGADATYIFVFDILGIQK